MPEKQKGVVPRLRFPEFRDAGEWEVKHLGEVCEILDSQRRPITSTDRERGSYPYYGASGIVDYVNDYIFDERLILIGEDGAKWGPFEKTAFIVDGKYWVNNHAHVLRAVGINDVVLENFLTMIDISPYITGAAPPKLTLDNLKGIKVPTPSELHEQQKIADCLSSLDEVIDLEAQKLEALKAHKNGLMQQLFPREGETIPRLRFPEFRDAGEWEVEAIADLVEKIAQGGTPSTTNPAYWNGGIPWVTPAEMGNDAAHHYLMTANRNISKLGLENSSAELLPPNSVILSSRAPIGYVAINKVPMATNQGCKGIIPNNSVYHEFLYFSLINAKRMLNDLGAGAGFKELSSGVLKSFRLPVPQVGEQQKIADCLSSLDEAITLQTRKLDALKAHKKGLMQQLFPQEVD